MKSRVGAKHRFEQWAPPGAFKRDPVVVHIRRAKSEVAKVFADLALAEPARYDLDELYNDVSEVIEKGGSITQSLKKHQLRRIPWVLFHLPKGKEKSEWIGCNHAILSDYQKWIMERQRSGPVHGIIHEFFRAYPREIATFDHWRSLAKLALMSYESPSLEQWKTACEAYSLLDDGAEIRFVEGLIFGVGQIDDKLKSAGFGDRLQQCAFLEKGLDGVLESASRLSDPVTLSESDQNNLLQFLTLDNELRFKNMRAKIAHALLRQYVDHDPHNVMKVRLRDWFVQHFGNPHLPSRSGWKGVPDALRLVVGRWLVDLFIDQFVDLIKETAMDRHWRFREAFWRSLSRRNLIRGIWFALGRDAMRHLKARNPVQGTESAVAGLTGAGSSQSVLLMQLAGMTIAEWSHNGSCRIWLHVGRYAPTLYEQSYHARSLRVDADFRQAHLGSERYHWQSRLADWLRGNGGPDITPEEYQLVNVRQTWSPE